ncbi:phosphoglycerate mutase-like protein [Amniculicola lignicola CBS 123094]|uniref:Phosphoglycerate mutase-like protein n=1 Tax=Amniculicola lignicola CBS 123094 TaxID=1392246 RepID=A0A6A5WI98_9PLEO|nr:phosphoglycerate mutase-like protein [Amniculicola lignicola CBS 123094]
MVYSKPVFSLSSTSRAQSVDLNWHAPKQTWINDLSAVLNGTGTHGFIFNSSALPARTPYGTYNWCNMPHVRKDIYPKANKEYELEYVEVIHRHHKRTPYASNTFPKEFYPWDCSDEGLFFYGQPLNPNGKDSAATYWDVYTSKTNPFTASGFAGTCQFPQITREGLDDSWQHGKDLYGVYHDLLGFLPKNIGDKVSYHVSSNVITSQVAGMLINGMFDPKGSKTIPLKTQPSAIDALTPSYPCPAAPRASSAYGVGSSNPNWAAHLTATKPLIQSLDSISGVASDSAEWHNWFDHYYDNLSARQCHAKPLPCKIGDTTKCITQEQADSVYRIGQYEYSFIYRDTPELFKASVGAYGVWMAELAQSIRDTIAGKNPIIYKHNVAHDGSISRLLSFLQVDVMVWVGMGSEVVFEVYKKGKSEKRYLRILWGGMIMTSSNPSLGRIDMIDVDVFLAYVDGLVGKGASKVVTYCQS